jgi:copper(I)-binding protein
MKLSHCVAAALVALVLPAVASAAIVVERPQIRATQPGQPTAAAYMVLRNTGAAPDKLVSAACACAESVMPHRSEVVNGVSRMVMADDVTIPAHGQVPFTPAGLHLMMIGVKGAIPAGKRVPMTLTFAKAGKKTVAFVATDAPGADAPAAAAHPHHMH